MPAINTKSWSILLSNLSYLVSGIVKENSKITFPPKREYFRGLKSAGKSGTWIPYLSRKNMEPVVTVGFFTVFSFSFRSCLFVRLHPIILAEFCFILFSKVPSFRSNPPYPQSYLRIIWCHHGTPPVSCQHQVGDKKIPALRKHLPFQRIWSSFISVPNQTMYKKKNESY